jgi:hypothetical protein
MRSSTDKPVNRSTYGTGVNNPPTVDGKRPKKIMGKRPISLYTKHESKGTDSMEKVESTARLLDVPKTELKKLKNLQNLTLSDTSHPDPFLLVSARSGSSHDPLSPRRNNAHLKEFQTRAMAKKRSSLICSPAAKVESLMAAKTENVVQATMRSALTEVMKTCEKYPPGKVPTDTKVGRFVAAIKEREASRPVGPKEVSELLQELGYANDFLLFDFLMNSKVFSYLQPTTCRLLIDQAVHLWFSDGPITESYAKEALLAARTDRLIADKNDRYVVQSTMRRALTDVMNHCEKCPPRTELPDDEVGRFVAAIEEGITPGQPFGPEELSELLQKMDYTNELKLFDFLMNSKAFSYLHTAICSLLIEHAVHLSRDGQIKESHVRSAVLRAADDAMDGLTGLI